MAIEIVMPPLSQTTDEVKLIGWLVKEGDTIQKGDPVCEVETDKVSMEVESFASGTVLKILAEPDSDIRVGAVIAVVGEAGEEVSSKLTPVAQAMAAERGIGTDGVVGTGLGGSVRGKDLAEQTVLSAAGLKATRMVRHMAEKRNIDLFLVQGTGPEGIITKDDLARYQPGAPAQPVFTGSASPVTSDAENTEFVLTGNQQAVALNLSRSMREIPHYYLKSTVYMEHLLQYRHNHPLSDGSGVSITALVVKAAALALSRHPRLNGYFQDGKVYLYNSIGIAVAAASGDELYVPVIRDTAAKEIKEIDSDIKWLSAKARSGKLEPSDLKGGTFTVSNLGMYPVDEFTAIISPKQAGILAVGRMEKKIVVGDGDEMRIRPSLTITAGFDHRVVNGLQGAEFLRTLKEIIEKELS